MREPHLRHHGDGRAGLDGRQNVCHLLLITRANVPTANLDKYALKGEPKWLRIVAITIDAHNELFLDGVGALLIY